MLFLIPVIAGNIKDTEKTLTAMKGVLDEGTSGNTIEQSYNQAQTAE